jgi:hypothetical protein
LNRFSSGQSIPILSFLKSALANGPVSIAELERQARSAALLGECQSITHSKLFKRAKRALGIRSIRNGFGAVGEWFWALPQDPCSDVAQSTGHVSTSAERRAQPQLGGIGIPDEWMGGVANLPRQRAPADVPLHRWRLFIDDCERFLDPKARWAAQAAALGWEALSLFGCAPTQPLAHMQVAGLIWALRGRNIARLYPNCASIEDPTDGSQYVFNRRPIYGTQIIVPWALR